MYKRKFSDDQVITSSMAHIYILNFIRCSLMNTLRSTKRSIQSSNTHEIKYYGL